MADEEEFHCRMKTIIDRGEWKVIMVKVPYVWGIWGWVGWTKKGAAEIPEYGGRMRKAVPFCLFFFFFFFFFFFLKSVDKILQLSPPAATSSFIPPYGRTSQIGFCCASHRDPCTLNPDRNTTLPLSQSQIATNENEDRYGLASEAES